MIVVLFDEKHKQVRVQPTGGSSTYILQTNTGDINFSFTSASRMSAFRGGVRFINM